MKILHMVAGAPTGGAETFCMDAIKSLHDQGVEQKVLCRPHDNFVNTLKPRGIDYVPARFNRFTKLFEKSRIKKEIAAFKPDLVHCWMSRASSFAPGDLDVPVLGWFGGPYKLKNYKNCDFYMGVTKDIVRHIIHETGEPHHSFVVHTFGTLDKDEPVTRADFDVPENAKTVLLLSRMHWKKGVDTLLEAALQVKDAYFLLAGDGPDLEKYKTQCADLGLDDRVRFLGWRNDRAALLNIADVCVLPSRYEPFGTVIAEAWFAGVPLVATRADGARQYVTHEKDGLLSDIDDVDALAANLKTALHDEDMRKTLVEHGTKTYDALFSKEVVTQALMAAYQNMMRIHEAPAKTVEVSHLSCPPGFKQTLDSALTVFKDDAEIDTAAVTAVAKAYLDNYDDTSIVIDACYEQAAGLFDFTAEGNNGAVRLLTADEIANIRANENLIRERSYYSAFTACFEPSAQQAKHGT